ncbi:MULTISPECIES: TetR/AcrR family transcriptional regulator [Mycobacteriaceae]|uniref:Tetracycline repressor protein class B from transposon Tn10 n=1 Tax=Mycobacteroides salmoniphilum TaxID=404941 RepID=A0A4R8SDH9_9MYCO|nr:TetR/AcrR family transcriptional regulator C-terminal domain-containing protein [Mycobacteroides salmoniphilum]TDZ93510.1 Tetracycline repressor protein class B from transposon Tn10 [Mycobacteroides salmoniphilum]TEA09293.1 Tetracycline repressor protein class B from transposon Tn10 [Mycobacteroides salmoniphilum]
MQREYGRSPRVTRGLRRRSTAGGYQLTAERIIDAATNLLERRGPEGLSARKLGMALGADPTAIYRYFTGMDDIVLAVADRLLGRAIAGFVPDSDWRLALRDLACRVHRVYVAHPHVAQVAFCRVTRRPNELAFVETVLRILREAGFTTDEAVLRYRALADTMLSFAGQDAGAEVLPAEVLEGDDSAWRAAYSEVSSDTHPYIKEARGLLAEQMPISSFVTALDFLLAGFGNPRNN